MTTITKIILTFLLLAFVPFFIIIHWLIIPYVAITQFIDDVKEVWLNKPPTSDGSNDLLRDILK